MKSLLVPALLAFATVAPVSAQKMGSANSNAPSCTSSITAGDMTVEVKFFSIVWGKTMENLTSEKGEAIRTRVNNSAEKAPLGELKTNADIMLGGKAVKAGSYSLFFTIDKDLKWHLNLAAKDGAKMDWTLDLKDSGHELKRLHVGITAGDEAGSARLNVGFGKQWGMVAIAAGAKDGDKEGKGGH